MNCFVHGGRAAVGTCAFCQRAVCHECVGRAAPRLICRDCEGRGSLGSYGWGAWYGYGYGFEYKSPTVIGGWPLVHVCAGIDPLTLRPRIAKGVVAVGNVAVGGLAIGGLALGLFTIGGVSVGLLCALGGAAMGVGVSIGGLAVGTIALGGAAVGFQYAVGGAAFGPATIDGARCDEAARAFLGRWFGGVPPACR